MYTCGHFPWGGSVDTVYIYIGYSQPHVQLSILQKPQYLCQ